MIIAAARPAWLRFVDVVGWLACLCLAGLASCAGWWLCARLLWAEPGGVRPTTSAAATRHDAVFVYSGPSYESSHYHCGPGEALFLLTVVTLPVAYVGLSIMPQQHASFSRTVLCTATFAWAALTVGELFNGTLLGAAELLHLFVLETAAGLFIVDATQTYQNEMRLGQYHAPDVARTFNNLLVRARRNMAVRCVVVYCAVSAYNGAMKVILPGVKIPTRLPKHLIERLKDSFISATTSAVAACVDLGTSVSQVRVPNGHALAAEQIKDSLVSAITSATAACGGLGTSVSQARVPNGLALAAEQIKDSLVSAITSATAACRDLGANVGQTMGASTLPAALLGIYCMLALAYLYYAYARQLREKQVRPHTHSSSIPTSVELPQDDNAKGNGGDGSNAGAVRKPLNLGPSATGAQMPIPNHAVSSQNAQSTAEGTPQRATTALVDATVVPSGQQATEPDASDGSSGDLRGVMANGTARMTGRRAKGKSTARAKAASKAQAKRAEAKARAAADVASRREAAVASLVEARAAAAARAGDVDQANTERPEEAETVVLHEAQHTPSAPVGDAPPPYASLAGEADATASTATAAAPLDLEPAAPMDTPEALPAPTTQGTELDPALLGFLDERGVRNKCEATLVANEIDSLEALRELTKQDMLDIGLKIGTVVKLQKT